MSDFSDLVTDVEKLIRQKTVLLADVENLSTAKLRTQEELTKMEESLSDILDEVEDKRLRSESSIKKISENQSRVIRIEMERLEELSNKSEIQEKELAETKSKQSQKENELRGLEVALIDREKNAILKEAEQKIQDHELSAKNDDISTKVSRLENYLKEIKIILQQDKDLKVELDKIQESNKARHQELQQFEEDLQKRQKLCIEHEARNIKCKNELQSAEDNLGKAIKENESYRSGLDKRKKDLEDKERALDAEKTEMAMKLAKANIKNK